ncbi:hypothetical protein OVA24_11780 [Luteolibacter sp. SL250]|uniref:fibronectin type III domain-containing protein n=1 Tax=Luteolibacter sp. SL250 TaxID=2995170 RepID=UPI00226DAC8D|nr:hypothetical protein [Luteolibacter sp. SL250]WAC17921.1 hypothetical protein OVA24_11780 [Luteolibacter sp. SL250]
MRASSFLPLLPLFSAMAMAAVPAAPLGFAMTDNSANSVTLTWYRPLVADATGHTLYVSDKKDGTFTKVPGAQFAERAVKIGKLPQGTTFYFKLTATNADGESPPTPPTQAFTITPSPGAPFPVKIAKNMCLTLGSAIVSTTKPVLGKLEDLVDGSDATSCGFKEKEPVDVRIKLDPKIPIADAEYLMLNFRTDSTGQGYAYNINWRALKTYTIIESHDSTDGINGTWTEIASGENKYLDGVIAFPNHKPKWIGVRNSSNFQLCRLDVFRAAPKGFHNDSWLFAGDSLVVQDMVGGSPERHSVWFSDLVRKQHPDRYPMVINSSQGGEMMGNTYGRMKNFLPLLKAPEGATVPVGTLLCYEPGFNDVGVGGGLWMGEKFIKMLTEAQDLCTANGMFLVPVRIEFSTGYLNLETLEPVKYNVFYNTLPVNLAGVDVFCRTKAPYALDPATQLPYADYWSYTRKNHATALAKDGVHHTKEGSDGINRLWAEVADKMIYSKQR